MVPEVANIDGCLRRLGSASRSSVVGDAPGASDGYAQALAARWPRGHRAASWFHASLSLGGLGFGALAWTALVPGRWLAVSAVMVFAVFGVLMMRGHFRVRMVPDTLTRLPLMAIAVATGGAVAMLLAAGPVVTQPATSFFVGLLCTLFVSLLVSQAVAVQFMRWHWRRGNLRASAIVFGSDSLARELAIEIDLRKEYGVDIVGFFSEADHGTIDIGAHLGENLDLAEAVERTGADRLIIGPSTRVDDRRAVHAARWAAANGLSVFVVPRLYEMGLGLDSMSPDRARGYPLVRVQRAAHPQLSRAMKRVFDVAVSATVLLLSLPVLLVVAVLVKVASPGPVFFAQERVGQGGRPIVIRKFRSMTTSATSDTEWTAEARVTGIGKWLRILSIDELPQLWSIIIGDMSLVGPRPERPAFVEKFSTEIDGYEERHRVRVGLTGLAQIAGLRGDTPITERVKYDNLYIDQWSFAGDLQIIVKTIAAILRQSHYAKQAVELEQAICGATPNQSYLEDLESAA